MVKSRPRNARQPVKKSPVKKAAPARRAATRAVADFSRIEG